MAESIINHKGYVRQIIIEKPTLENNTGDDLRLEAALKKELSVPSVKIPWNVLRHLPSNLRSWNFAAKAVLFQDLQSWRLVDILPLDRVKPILGAALDIGTTTIVLSLIDLETGREMEQISFDNPQRAIGPDILARIHHSRRKGGLANLQGLVIKAMNSSLYRLCQNLGLDSHDIFLMVGAGNTAMTHLFMGIEAFEIIKEPYIPCSNIPDTFNAKFLDIDIHPEGLIFLFPNIGSYFGGDLLAGILHANIDRKDSPCIMMDVGTNAEIILGDKNWLIACAGAAGPALEGGMSKMGMTAGPGVIDRVFLNKETYEICYHTIGNLRPVGICGSGMIDLAAVLFMSGYIDIRGKFSEEKCKNRLYEMDRVQAFVLVTAKDSGTGYPIVISQVDINSLTTSKAAMYTILEIIVQNTAGLQFGDLDTFYVAGTFGSFINPESAITIGMLPDIDRSKFQVIGNSSLGGAKLMLTDTTAFNRIIKIRNSITYIELNVNQEFMNIFSGAKFYPHTDCTLFPSVVKVGS